MFTRLDELYKTNIAANSTAAIDKIEDYHIEGFLGLITESEAIPFFVSLGIAFLKNSVSSFDTVQGDIGKEVSELVVTLIEAHMTTAQQEMMDGQNEIALGYCRDSFNLLISLQAKGKLKQWMTALGPQPGILLDLTFLRLAHVACETLDKLLQILHLDSTNYKNQLNTFCGAVKADILQYRMDSFESHYFDAIFQPGVPNSGSGIEYHDSFTGMRGIARLGDNQTQSVGWYADDLKQKWQQDLANEKVEM